MHAVRTRRCFRDVVGGTLPVCSDLRIGRRQSQARSPRHADCIVILFACTQNQTDSATYPYAMDVQSSGTYLIKGDAALSKADTLILFLLLIVVHATHSPRARRPVSHPAECTA